MVCSESLAVFRQSGRRYIPQNHKENALVSPPYQQHYCFEVIHPELYLNDSKLAKTALSSAETSQKQVMAFLVFPATKAILPRTM